MIWILLLFATATALLGACGGGPPVETEIRSDSGSVEIVLAPTTDRILRWELEREIVLGGAADGPESFYRVRRGSVDADEAGNLYVLDRTSHRVSAFDASGEARWTAGGSGGGPGELLTPISISVTPDGTVHVYDLGKAALVRFDSEGAVLPHFEFSPGFIGGGAIHVRALSDALVVLGREPYAGSDDRPVELSRIGGRDTTVLVSGPLHLTRTAAYPSCGMSVAFPVPFAAEAHWDARGERVVINVDASYRIDVFEADRLVRSIRRAIEPRPISRAIALEQVRQVPSGGGPLAPCRVTPSERLENHGYATEQQVIQAIAVSPDGEIWVRRSGGLDGSPGPIDLFDGDGSYLGSLPPETPFPVVLLPGSRIGFAESDTFDVERLVIARLHRD